MSGEKLKAGDVVKLKSGGPQMTIQEISGSQASCTWFNNKHELSSSWFSVESIRIVTPGEDGPLPIIAG